MIGRAIRIASSESYVLMQEGAALFHPTCCARMKKRGAVSFYSPLTALEMGVPTTERLELADSCRSEFSIERLETAGKLLLHHPSMFKLNFDG